MRPFAEGLAPVKVGHQWGLIDPGGRLRLQPKWNEIGQFVNGLAPARLNPAHLNPAHLNPAHLNPAHLNEGAGYINSTGAWAIAPEFRKAGPFFGDLATVQIDDAPAYVRVDGKIVWRGEPHAFVPRPPVLF